LGFYDPVGSHFCCHGIIWTGIRRQKKKEEEEKEEEKEEEEDGGEDE
jgi:hypothetical protein